MLTAAAVPIIRTLPVFRLNSNLRSLRIFFNSSKTSRLLKESRPKSKMVLILRSMMPELVLIKISKISTPSLVLVGISSTNKMLFPLVRPPSKTSSIPVLDNNRRSTTFQIILPILTNNIKATDNLHHQTAKIRRGVTPMECHLLPNLKCIGCHLICNLEM